MSVTLGHAAVRHTAHKHISMKRTINIWQS